MIATVGTFDGVHLGHRYLLSQLRSEATARGLRPLAVTFDRHPLSIVAPELAPPAITGPEEQAALIGALGVDLLRLEFTPALRAMTGAEFLTMLHRDHGVKALMLGFNNHLGSDRSTAPEVPGVELVGCAELPHHARVSSSSIRALIAEGDIGRANSLLGHPFTIEGEVGGGRQLGRQLGFPTANVSVAPGRMLPAPGVYAGCASGHPAVVNVGSRPTVDAPGAPVTVEAHLIGFSGNLYGRTLRLELLRRLRPERRFGSLDELRAAIASDIENTLDNGLKCTPRQAEGLL